MWKVAVYSQWDERGPAMGSIPLDSLQGQAKTEFCKIKYEEGGDGGSRRHIIAKEPAAQFSSEEIFKGLMANHAFQHPSFWSFLWWWSFWFPPYGVEGFQGLCWKTSVVLEEAPRTLGSGHCVTVTRPWLAWLPGLLGAPRSWAQEPRPALLHRRRQGCGLRVAGGAGRPYMLPG